MKTLIWYAINIREKFRGCGYGSVMYARVEEYARENGVEIILGNVTDPNTSGFFKKLGFRYVKGDSGPCCKEMTDEDVFVFKMPKGIVEEVRKVDWKLKPDIFPMDKRTKTKPRMIEWKTEAGELVGKTKVKKQKGKTWGK
jgi:predicted GNAT family acetyltransferase